MSMANNISERIITIREKIHEACRLSGRDSSSVTLIAATKGQPPHALLLAYEAGIRSFGENYLQEALPKIEALPDDSVWHYIGALQSNKAPRIAEQFAFVHTLATEKAAARLSKAGNPLDVFIEVNIANESSKQGVSPSEVANFAEKVYYLPGIRLRGLMTMGPANPNPEEARPYFIKLRRLLESLGDPQVDCLSMGMTSDFEVAIQEGATHVRIGTGIFGSRTTK